MIDMVTSGGATVTGGRLRFLLNARILPLAAVAGIYVYLLVILVPYLLYNNLLKGDGAGHLMLVEFTADHLLPWGSGWCDRVWGGFPAGELYPPLFHIIAGLLSRLLGAAAAVKTVTACVWVAIPPGIFLLAGRLARSRDNSAPPLLHTVLILALWCGLNVPNELLGIRFALGASVESSIGNGMCPSALGFMFYVYLLWTLVGRGRRRLTLTSVLLALCVLSHPVWGLVAAASALLTAMTEVALAAGSKRGEAVLRWAGSGILAFLLAGFFAVPLLAHQDLMSPIHLPSGWPARFWIFLCGAFALLIYRWRILTTSLRTNVGLAAIMTVAVALGDRGGWPFHLFRLTIPITILLMPALLYALYQPDFRAENTDGNGTDGRRTRRRVLRLLRVANFLMILVLAGLFHLMGPVFPSGNPDMAVPNLTEYARTDGRILAVADDGHSSGYMAVPYVTVKGGGAVSHGISVESATSARAMFGMVRKLSPHTFVWGIDMYDNPAMLVRDPDFQVGERQLAILGISHILTDRRRIVPARVGRPREEVAFTFHNYNKEPSRLSGLAAEYYLTQDGRTFQYRLVDLKHPSLAEAGPAVLGIPAELFPRYSNLWFANGGKAPIPVESYTGEIEPDPQARASVVSISAQGDMLEVDVECGVNRAGPCPVYVKVNYHPHWCAEDSGGAPLPLHRAGLGMLVLATPGAVKLEYSAGACAWVGRAMTAGAIGFLALLLLLPYLRRRPKP